MVVSVEAELYDFTMMFIKITEKAVKLIKYIIRLLNPVYQGE